MGSGMGEGPVWEGPHTAVRADKGLRGGTKGVRLSREMVSVMRSGWRTELGGQTEEEAAMVTENQWEIQGTGRELTQEPQGGGREGGVTKAWEPRALAISAHDG